jgi:hypothetical protein
MKKKKAQNLFSLFFVFFGTHEKSIESNKKNWNVTNGLVFLAKMLHDVLSVQYTQSRTPETQDTHTQTHIHTKRGIRAVLHNMIWVGGEGGVWRVGDVRSSTQTHVRGKSRFFSFFPV